MDHVSVRKRPKCSERVSLDPESQSLVYAPTTRGQSEVKTRPVDMCSCAIWHGCWRTIGVHNAVVTRRRRISIAPLQFFSYKRIFSKLKFYQIRERPNFHVDGCVSDVIRSSCIDGSQWLLWNAIDPVEALIDLTGRWLQVKWISFSLRSRTIYRVHSFFNESSRRNQCFHSARTPKESSVIATCVPLSGISVVQRLISVHCFVLLNGPSHEDKNNFVVVRRVYESLSVVINYCVQW